MTGLWVTLITKDRGSRRYRAPMSLSKGDVINLGSFGSYTVTKIVHNVTWSDDGVTARSCPDVHCRRVGETKVMEPARPGQRGAKYG